MGSFAVEVVEVARKVLASRKRPRKLLLQYDFLHAGSSDALASKLLSQLPTDGNHSKRQWSTMRADKEKAWLESMGWEFIFVIDLMLDSIA